MHQKAIFLFTSHITHKKNGAHVCSVFLFPAYAGGLLDYLTVGVIRASVTDDVD